MLAAREAFSRKLFSRTNGRRWANYDDLNALEYAPRLRDLRREYLAGRAGEKTGARSAAHREASVLSNAGAQVLELYLALSRVGLAGSIAEQSELARHVDRLIGRCRLRKARYGLRQLVDDGWIVPNLIPTGRHKQRSNGRWTTCQVVQYTVAPKALSLLPAAAAGRVGSTSVASSSCSSSPRASAENPLQEAPTTAREEATPPFLRQGGVDFRQTDIDQVKPSGELEQLEEATEVEPTRPAAAAADTRTTSRQGAFSANAPHEVGSRSRSSSTRKAWRRGAPRTWATGRRALLEDLADHTSKATRLSPTERATILAAAAAQTQASYDASHGIALEWAPLVLGWLDLPLAERRDELIARIVPALRALIVPPGPRRPSVGRPNELQARELRISQEQAATRDAHAQPRIPIDAGELEELRSVLYLARATLRHVACGRLILEELEPGLRQKVERCVEVFGPLV